MVGVKNSVLKESISIYPNPSEPNSTLEIFSLHDETARILLYNGLGQLVSEEKIKLIEGNNKKEIASQKLSIGLYTLKIIGNEFNAIKQFIKE